MGAAVALGVDFEAKTLRALARRSEDAGQVRRLPALPAIYDGADRTTAAALGGVGLQTLRDWVLRFNAAGADGLLTGRAPGNAPLLDAERREALRRVVEAGPIPAVHGVVRWRLVDLAQWLWEEYRLPISKQTLSRVLRSMGFRKLSARPRHHAKDEAAEAAFKKTSPRAWRRSPRAGLSASP
jgi:transposase